MAVQALDIADELTANGGFDKRQAEAIGRVVARSLEADGRSYATALQLENVETRLGARLDVIKARMERDQAEPRAAIARQGRLLIVATIAILGGFVAFIQFLA